MSLLPDYIHQGILRLLSGGISSSIVSGTSAAFTSGITIQGLAVIKDGDPVGMAGSGAAGQIMYTGVSGLDNKWALSVYVVSGSVTGGAGSTNVSGNSVSVYGYSYSLISGANIFNVQSGASTLHLISVNQWVSGGQVEIRDSLSGLVGTLVGTIAVSETTLGVPATVAVLTPATLTYDVYMKSGIVISTSGTGLNATVSFRNPA